VTDLAVSEVVRRLGGRAQTAVVLQRVSRRELDRALRVGDVVRATRGVYALPTLPAPRAVAARVRGVLSHASAAEHYRLKTVTPPDRVHVTVAPGRKPRPVDGVRFHYRTLAPDEVTRRGVTTVLRTVLDCAAVMPFREALAVADSALRQDLLLPDELLAGAVVLRGPFSAGPQRVARLADGRAANPFESALRAVLLDAGLAFTPQVTITSDTSSARVDLADARLRLVVEGDSYTYHGTRPAFTADCVRYDELVRARWVVLRFAWEHVMFDDRWLVEVVRDVVAWRRQELGLRRR
jgi:very-short-patch-repair endonuclease